MALKTTRNSNLKTTQKNTIKSKDVVTNKNLKDNKNTIQKNFISDNSTSNKETINSNSILKTTNNFSNTIKDTAIKNISVNRNISSNQNTGSLKTRNSNTIKDIAIKNISVNRNISSNQNIGSLKTSNSNTIKNTATKNINNNVSSAKFGIYKVRNNQALKIVKTKVKTKIKNDTNNFTNKDILKSTALDTNYHGEIGSNTLKSTYNAVIKTKRSVKNTKKTLKTISKIPENYKKVKFNIKNIPQQIKSQAYTIKKTSKATKVIFDDIKRGNIKGVLRGIQLGIEFKGISTLIKNVSKVNKKGLKNSGNKIKTLAVNSDDVTSDLGANTVFTAISGVKGTTETGVRAYKHYKKINTSVKKSLKNTNIGTLKTKIKKNRIAENVKNHFNKFKSSKVTKKIIKKHINTFKKKVKEIINHIFKIILKNPIILGVIAILIVGFLIFNIIINSIMGVHGSYFIEIEPNQNQWINEINKLNDNTSSKFKEYNNVKVIKNSGAKADWRDVLIAYYMKNNNKIDLSGNDTLLGGVTSVDPETWEKVFDKLKSYLDTPYFFGGSDPSTGFDCSGLVQYCYGQFGISLPRVTYDQVKCGSHVEYNELQAGDLVFFAKDGDVHHVGVYIGNGEYLHAPRTGDVVKVSKMSGRNDFYEGRRVFEVKETNNNSNSGNKNDKILYTALPNNTNLVDMFYKVEQETGVDSILLASIAMTESSFDPNCISGAGASGLCQMMPETFKELGFDISMIFDPYTNIKACAFEVTSLYKYSCITNVTDMLKAYNAGIGNFMKYNGNIPFSETIQYPGKVLGYYTQFSNGQQPSDIQGNGSFVSGVNTQLLQVYNCFVKFYKQNDKWVLRIYTLEEALENLKFSKEEKEEFYNFKQYNDKFDDETQFGGYDVNFKFGF